MPDPLVFGPPARSEHIGTASGPTPSPRTPESERQGSRLNRQFRSLQETLDERRASLLDSGVDADPDLIAVFDLIGSVDGFYRAVARIEGLEFLADIEDDDLEPDEDFFFEKDEEATDQLLPHTLYLVATNAQAIRELLTLWDRWVEDPEAEFGHGLARFKYLFSQLRGIRPWGPEDRLRDSGLIEDWTERVQMSPQQAVPVEVELWFRADAERRQSAADAVTTAITEAGGDVLASAVLPEIRYHGIRATIPRGAVETVLAGDPEDLDLLVTEEVMFVRPATRAAAILAEESEERAELGLGEPLPDKEPRVALLDGMPLSAHASLVDRLVIVDPNDLESEYPAAARQHGTSMASLIIHGDLSAPGEPISSQLYVRPILVPNGAPAGPREVAPTERLFVDVLHGAIRDIFAGPPEVGAPSVRAITLAICDPARHFVREMSPLARLLDWAAHEFNVLIIVSAGNHEESLKLALPPDDVPSATAEELQVAAITRLHSESLHRRLLAPAESINALTIGASATDASGPVADHRIDLFPTAHIPAPYSSRGSGFRRSVKPEALYPGGRVLYSAPLVSTAEESDMHAAPSAVSAPGVLSAAPGAPGSTTAVRYGYGTSQAAALAARAAAQACDVLERLAEADPENPCLDPEFWPAILKAMTAHPARWGDAQDVYANGLGLDRPDMTRAIGYGAVDERDVCTSRPERAILIGGGQLSHKDQDTFQLPLPPGLRAKVEWRRLTLTLGWISPIAPQTRRRRAARVWFDPPTSDAGVDRTEAEYHAARRGTLQHEVLEGDAALAFADGDALAIRVSCRIDHLPASTSVNYGLVASLEVGPTVGIDVHNEIAQQLQTQILTQVQVGSQTT